jgi:1-acyl-sn-glycerol-3-phosphate acyltransferase
MGAMAMTMLALGALWGAWAGVCALAERRNPRPGDPLAGLAALIVRVYARVLHRVRFEGLEHVPSWRPGDEPAGPLVVVANHSAGVDPLLIQAACGFEVRWMMMRMMMVPAMAGLWDWAGIIAVEQNGRDTRAVREALRHLEGGGVLGIFPEGEIARPPGTVMEFQPGVGLIVGKSGAPVLVAVIEGTPSGVHAFASLFTPSRARVRFLGVVRYAPRTSPGAIAADLRARVMGALGWGPSPEVHQPTGMAGGSGAAG